MMRDQKVIVRRTRLKTMTLSAGTIWHFTKVGGVESSVTHRPDESCPVCFLVGIGLNR